MEMNLTLISFLILLLLLFFKNNTAGVSTHELLAERRLLDDGDPCSKAFCGEGKCVNSTTIFGPGFDCICNPGWSKPQWEIFVFPACTLPNCTVSSTCGNGAQPPTVLLPPPPPPPVNPQPFNPFNPCNLVWCGDGTCVLSGLGYYCKCNEGSANVLNISGAACLSECFLGADCKGVSFRLGPYDGSQNSPPTQPGNGNGPFGSPASPQAIPNHGSNTTNGSSDRRQVRKILLIICLIFLSLI